MPCGIPSMLPLFIVSSWARVLPHGGSINMSQCHMDQQQVCAQSWRACAGGCGSGRPHLARYGRWSLGKEGQSLLCLGHGASAVVVGKHQTIVLADVSHGQRGDGSRDQTRTGARRLPLHTLPAVSSDRNRSPQMQRNRAQCHPLMVRTLSTVR